MTATISQSAIKSEFDHAIRALSIARPYQIAKSITSNIGTIGLVIASCLAIATLIRFSAIPIAYSTGMGAASIGLIVLSRFINKKAHAVQDKAVPFKKRAELAARYFKEQMLQTKEYDLQKMDAIKLETNKLYRLFYIHYGFSLGVKQFGIDDRELSDDLILELLETAAENGVILHLRSLEDRSTLLLAKATPENLHKINKKWLEEALKKNASDPLVRRSTLLSARFLKVCFDKKDLTASQINNQLEALAVKYVMEVEKAGAVKPAFQLSENRHILLTSRCGEVGTLEEILGKLGAQTNGDMTIEIHGRGFRFSYLKLANLEKEAMWKEIIERFVQTTHYAAKVVDMTHTKAEDIWQLKK